MMTIKRTLIALAAVGFALGALAGQSAGRNDGSRRIQLRESEVLLGATVPPGEYVLSWARERGSERVRIEIARGKKTVAAGKGLWVSSEEASPYESLVYRPDAKGTNGLAEIRFKGTADAIRLDADTAGADIRAEAK